jgi:putative permease
MKHASLSQTILRSDWLKLVFVLGAVIGTLAVFFVNPTLSSPTAISIIASMMLSPVVSWAERKGLSRIWSILAIFLTIGAALTLTSLWATQSAMSEWENFKVRAPEYFERSVERLRHLEDTLKTRFPVLERYKATEALLKWGQESGRWFLVNGPALIGDMLTWAILVPFLTFVFLLEGRKLRNRILDLIPNRFFESTVMISSQVSHSVSDYIRAKFIEAFLVALLTTVGFWIVGAPYAVFLGSFAGVTNILPYIGPVIGAVPGILIMLAEPAYHAHLVPVALVYVVANLVDSIFIFPIFVAKIVNLHPLVLIVAVMIGQQYYGLVGMLVSIPIAAALKVLLKELHWMIYQPGQRRNPFDN